VGAIGFGLLVLGKVLMESASGTALLTDTHWPAVPMAHLAGAMAGVVVGLACSRRRDRAGSPSMALLGGRP